MNLGSEDANEVFQELTETYARLLGECRTTSQRDTLRKAWLSVGGLAAAASIAFTDPTLTTLVRSYGEILFSDELTSQARVTASVARLPSHSLSDHAALRSAPCTRACSAVRRLPRHLRALEQH